MKNIQRKFCCLPFIFWETLICRTFILFSISNFIINDGSRWFWFFNSSFSFQQLSYHSQYFYTTKVWPYREELSVSRYYHSWLWCCISNKKLSTHFSIHDFDPIVDIMTRHVLFLWRNLIAKSVWRQVLRRTDGNHLFSIHM